MARAQTPTTTLWALVEAMHSRLEGEGLESAAVDAEVVRGLRSLLCRDMFASARGSRGGAGVGGLLIFEPERA